MFDAKRIGKMKESAILVNVGRGFIVNTEDLTKAIEFYVVGKMNAKEKYVELNQDIIRTVLNIFVKSKLEVLIRK